MPNRPGLRGGPTSPRVSTARAGRTQPHLGVDGRRQAAGGEGGHADRRGGRTSDSSSRVEAAGRTSITRHPVTLSPCHLVTPSPRHLVTPSPRHRVTPSPSFIIQHSALSIQKRTRPAETKATCRRVQQPPAGPLFSLPRAPALPEAETRSGPHFSVIQHSALSIQHFPQLPGPIEAGYHTVLNSKSLCRGGGPADCNRPPAPRRIAERRKMTDDQFAVRVKHIEEQAGEMQARVQAYRDQEIARLFVQSGWTQERIAEQMGKSQQWVSYRLVFGQFLQFTTDRGKWTKAPKNLTEWRFRGYFEQTDKDAKEPRRFAEVIRLMENDFAVATTRPPAWVGDRIAAEFADREWRHPEAIAEMIGAPVEQVVSVLEAIKHYGLRKRHCEKRVVGKQAEYRLVKGGGKKIDLETLRVEVSPIIKQLKIEGQKNMATFSPLTVLDMAHKLEVLLDKLAK